MTTGQRRASAEEWRQRPVLGAQEPHTGPEAWMLEGTCRTVDPEMWWPAKGENPWQAKAICRECPVQALCLDHALTHRELFGIWGGKTARERQKLRRAA